MTRGIAKVSFPASEGLISHNETGNWSFIYETSLTKSDRWNIGDRVALPDGRVFRYAKSGGACWTGRGNIFNNAIPATGIDYSLLAAASAVGDYSVTMTNQGVVAQTKDGLRGGLIILKPLAGSTDKELQFRGITGNTAGGVSDEITIYLDGPLTEALTTASYAFCMPSPYTDIRFSAAANDQSYAGIPAVEVDAADTYFWLQTWGLCWLAPQGEVGTSTKQRDCVFKEDGSIQHKGTTDATWLNGQRAGFIVDNNAAANGSTIFMLMISP
jgi:hypothetical protein